VTSWYRAAHGLAYPACAPRRPACPGSRAHAYLDVFFSPPSKSAPPTASVSAAWSHLPRVAPLAARITPRALSSVDFTTSRHLAASASVLVYVDLSFPAAATDILPLSPPCFVLISLPGGEQLGEGNGCTRYRTAPELEALGWVGANSSRAVSIGCLDPVAPSRRHTSVGRLCPQHQVEHDQVRRELGRDAQRLVAVRGCSDVEPSYRRPVAQESDHHRLVVHDHTRTRSSALVSASARRYSPRPEPFRTARLRNLNSLAPPSAQEAVRLLRRGPDRRGHGLDDADRGRGPRAGGCWSRPRARRGDGGRASCCRRLRGWSVTALGPSRLLSTPRCPCLALFCFPAFVLLTGYLIALAALLRPAPPGPLARGLALRILFRSAPGSYYLCRWRSVLRLLGHSLPPLATARPGL